MPKTKGARDLAYEAKRGALLDRLQARLIRHDETRPSLQALAASAGVSVPTLRHYFGARGDVIAAVLEALETSGRPYIARAALPAGPLEESIRAWLQEAVWGMRRTALGDLLAAGMIEGLLDGRLGPACVRHLLEPSLGSLVARLEAHQAAGEMRAADARHAALILFAPVFLACQHQDQLGGRTSHPLDMDALLEEQVRAFVAAYATERPPR